MRKTNVLGLVALMSIGMAHGFGMDAVIPKHIRPVMARRIRTPQPKTKEENEALMSAAEAKRLRRMARNKGVQV